MTIVRKSNLAIGIESQMTSVVNDERQGQRRRRNVLLERSHMGIDDDLLRDVLSKVRARRARRTHPSPTYRRNGSYLGGLEDLADGQQSSFDEGKTNGLSDDPCCTDFRCFDMLGMEAKSRKRHLVRNGRAIEDNPLRRTTVFPRQRDSESIGSTRSLNSSRMSRNDASLSSSMRSNQSADIKMLRDKMSRSSHEDESIAWWRPEDSQSMTSGSFKSLNASLASRAHSASNANNKGVSKPSGFQSTLDPKTRNEEYVLAGNATKQRDSTAIVSNSSRHASSTARSKGASKPHVNQSTVDSEKGRKGHIPTGRAEKVGGSEMFESNLPTNHLKLNRKKRKEGQECAGCGATQGDSSVFGSDISIHSRNTASNKGFGIRSLFQSKTRQQRRTCARCETKQGGSSTRGSNSSLQSHNTGSSKLSYKSRDMQSKSKAIQKKGVTQKNPGKSPSIRSSSDALSKTKSRASFAPGASRASASNSSLHSKGTARSIKIYKLHGMQSKAPAIRQASVSGKGLGKRTSVGKSSNSPSMQIQSKSQPIRQASVTGKGTGKYTSVSKSSNSLSKQIQSKSQAIMQERVARKSPEKYSSISDSSNASSDQIQSKSQTRRRVRKRPDKHTSRSDSSDASSNQNSVSSSSSDNSGKDSNRSGVYGHDEAAKTSSPHDFAGSWREGESRKRLVLSGDSVSTLSLPSTSMAQARKSILARDRLNPVYPGDRFGYQDTGGDYSSGDDSTEGSDPKHREVGKVVNSVRSTAREILSYDEHSVIAESKKGSIDDLIDSVFDKLDELDDSLLSCDGKQEPPKRWLPKLQVDVKW